MRTKSKWWDGRTAICQCLSSLSSEWSKGVFSRIKQPYTSRKSIMHFSRVSFISFLTLVLNPSSQACLLTSSLVTLATALPSPATGVLRYSYQPSKHPPFKCSKGRSTRKSRLKIPQTGLGVSIQGERDENFDFSPE